MKPMEIDDITARICDEYCKWPERCSTETELYTQHCDDCPLGLLEAPAPGRWEDSRYSFPKTEEIVLVVAHGRWKNITFKNALLLGEYYEDEGIWEIDGYHDAKLDVTHWMPLPDPPKEFEK